MKKYAWLIPATASLVFLLFSLRVIVAEGLFGFVAEHTRNGWSAQIGTDLVLSATVALFALAPHARRHGLRVAPWVVLTYLLGSIGLLAWAAYILYVRAAAPEKLPHAQPA